MKNQICCLLSVLCFVPLAACDLHDKILSIDDHQPIIIESDASEYIQPTSRDDYTQYASDSDYVMPAQTTIQKTQSRAAQISQPMDVVQPKPEPDDVLLVPAKVAAAAPKPVIVMPKSGEIIVAKGDTLYSLSKKNGISLRDLVDANNLAAPFAISVGQKLKIPSAQMHVVASGDTLYSISRRYSVDLNSLALENKIAAPYSLSVGQRLRLPGKVRTFTPSPVIAPVAGPIVSAVSATQVTKAPEIFQPAVAPGIKMISEKTKVSSAPARPLPMVATQKRMTFNWPVRGKILSSFGYKKNGLYNDGINIKAASGTLVKAAETGVVAYAGNELKGMGNLVIIQHANGWMSVYAHLDAMNVRRGAKVAKGERIGTIGKTGKVSEPQLHFEIRKGTKAYDPEKELK